MRWRRAAALLVGTGLLLITVSCRVAGSAQSDPAGLATLTNPTSSATDSSDTTASAETTDSPDATDSTPAESTPDTTTRSTSSTPSTKIVSITVQQGDPDLLIGTIWSQALTHRGYRIKLTHMSGGIEQPLTALSAGATDLAVSYSGYALNHFRPNSSGSPQEIYRQLEQALPTTIEALAPGKADSNYAVVVTRQTASKLHLAGIGDLAKQQGVTLAVPDFWDATKDPQKRLLSTYGLSGLSTRKGDTAGSVTARMLTSGQVQAAVLFNISSVIDQQKLVVLADPKFGFVPDFLVPLAHDGALDETTRSTINAVDAKLDTTTLRRLQSEVNDQHESATTVADRWLTSVGLG